jgi:hypothetical protein
LNRSLDYGSAESERLFEAIAGRGQEKGLEVENKNFYT